MTTFALQMDRRDRHSRGRRVRGCLEKVRVVHLRLAVWAIGVLDSSPTRHASARRQHRSPMPVVRAGGDWVVLIFDQVAFEISGEPSYAQSVWDLPQCGRAAGRLPADSQ